jgi:hypothetical protein
MKAELSGLPVVDRVVVHGLGFEIACAYATIQ